MKTLPYKPMTPEEITKARLAMMVGFAFLAARQATNPTQRRTK